MMLRNTRRTRRGAAIVEAAFTLAIFCLLLFGIFEYCRYLFVLHVTDLATREGARYACVNADKPTNFDTTPYTDGAGRTYVSIKTYAEARMGGTAVQIVGYQFAVYAVDPAGLLQTPPVVRPKSKSGTVFPNPFNPSDSNKQSWNFASFPDRIAVHVRGTFRPFLPSLLKMSDIPVNVISMSGVEG
ncbi:TadE family protein [Gemmata sp.]|uniref:TadE family protein n=1 Tax=Gemmata sp. TaxID=1914242 RepID=UPI003F6F6C34